MIVADVTACPRIADRLTACIVWDGRLALTDLDSDGGGLCAGCGLDPVRGLAVLAGVYPPAGAGVQPDADAAADLLRIMVAEYVKAGRR